MTNSKKFCIISIEKERETKIGRREERGGGEMKNKVEQVKRLIYDVLIEKGVPEVAKQIDALYNSPEVPKQVACLKPDNCWGCKFADIPNRLCTLLKEVKNEIGIIHTNDVPKWCPVPSTLAKDIENPNEIRTKVRQKINAMLSPSGFKLTAIIISFKQLPNFSIRATSSFV